MLLQLGWLVCSWLPSGAAPTSIFLALCDPGFGCCARSLSYDPSQSFFISGHSLRERTEGSLAGNSRQYLIIVVWLFGLGRRLHFHQMHAAKNATVRANLDFLVVDVIAAKPSHFSLRRPRNSSSRLP